MRGRSIDRALAKVITARGITDDIFALLEENRAKRPGEDPAAALKVWDAARVPFATIIIKHLDAYDQRET